MKKMPCVFVRDFSARPAIATRDVTPGCEWVLAGEGLATRKWDGTSALVEGGRIFARYDCKRGKTPPAGAIPCDPAPDEKTGHWPHWVLVEAQPEYRWHAEALQQWTGRYVVTPRDGTYEVVGPKISANPEGFSEHRMIPHGTVYYSDLSDTPITFDAIRDLLSKVKIEGLVFHHLDGRMAKIRRGDFGLQWPVEWVDAEIGRIAIAMGASASLNGTGEDVDFEPLMPNDHPLDMAFAWSRMR